MVVCSVVDVMFVCFFRRFFVIVAVVVVVVATACAIGAAATAAVISHADRAEKQEHPPTDQSHATHP